MVAVDVAAHAAGFQQRHVVLAGQQAHVVHLRNAGQEELDRARDQVGAVVAAQRVVEGAVDLVQVQVAGGRAGGRRPVRRGPQHQPPAGPAGRVAGQGGRAVRADRAGTRGGGAAERKSALIAFFDKQLSNYKTLFAEYEKNGNPYVAQRNWEISSYIVNGLDILKQSVDQIELESFN